MSQVAVPIQGTFDVAVARNMLRKKVSESRAASSLSARSAAMLTALAELILFSHTASTIEISMVERSGALGVELNCSVCSVTNKQLWIGQAQRWLGRVADEMTISERINGLQITARVWTSSR